MDLRGITGQNSTLLWPVFPARIPVWNGTIIDP
jgi:hypothetical protein